MKPPAAPGKPVADSGPQLISELFHALNQPITALRCSLELSLHRPRVAEQDRDTLRMALDQAEQIARLSTGIRELLQADDPGDNCQALPLQSYLREAVADFQPVAEARRIELVLRSAGACHVWLEPCRLRQAMFCLLESVLNASPADTAVAIEATEQGSDSVITLTWAERDANLRDRSAVLGLETPGSGPSQRLGWAIARRIVESAGGTVEGSTQPDCGRIELRLPLVAVPV
jgi:two-component system OmpR family sensor kinase